MYYDLHVRYDFPVIVLMKLEFSGQIFEKYQSIRFHKNPFSRSSVDPLWQTDNRQRDRHVEANSRFSQLCDCA